MEYKPVSLSTIANGAAEELFQAELQEILENIQNINTDPESKRSITIQLVFQPNDDRRILKVGVAVKKNIAAVRGAATVLYTGDAKRDGKFQALEHNPKQLRLSEAQIAKICAHKNTSDGACTDCGEVIAAKEKA